LDVKQLPPSEMLGMCFMVSVAYKRTNFVRLLMTTEKCLWIYLSRMGCNDRCVLVQTAHNLAIF